MVYIDLYLCQVKKQKRFITWYFLCGDEKMSLFDEDEMDCECCGHVGLIFNGDFDVEYPVCGAEYSLIDDSIW